MSDETLIIVSSIATSILVSFLVVIAIMVFKKDICAKYPSWFFCKSAVSEGGGPGPGSGSGSGGESNAVGGGKGSGGDTILTNYWIGVEGSSYLIDCGSEGPRKSPPGSKGKEVVLGSGTKNVVLPGKGGKALAKVDGYTWDACYCEGSCRVGNKTFTLQKEGSAPYWEETRGFGTGCKDNLVTPFVSITADKRFKYGSKVYIDALDGFKLPTGEVHNGCVRVDDCCGDGCEKNQIDFNVGYYKHYKAMAGKLREKVNAKLMPNCTIKKYKL